LPGPSPYYLTFEDFTNCVNKGILEFVERLPQEIFDESVKLSLMSPTLTPKLLSNENIKSKKLELVSEEDRNS
jgi:hypothetical protein